MTTRRASGDALAALAVGFAIGASLLGALAQLRGERVKVLETRIQAYESVMSSNQIELGRLREKSLRDQPFRCASDSTAPNCR